MTIRNFVIFLLALSLFSLAGSIVFFSLKLADTNKAIPATVSTIDAAIISADRLLSESKAIRQVVDSIVKETEETRRYIPLIIDESEKIRAMVPIFSQESQAIREQFTAVLNVVERVEHQIPLVLSESAELRALVPQILEEIAITRESIPGFIDDVDTIIQNTDQIGKSTTEGVVTGVVTGMLKTPFRVLSSFGKAIFGVDEKTPYSISTTDLEIIRKETFKLLASERQRQSVTWSNSDTDKSGTLTMRRPTISTPDNCRLIDYVVISKEERTLNRTVQFCLDKNEQWQPTVL